MPLSNPCATQTACNNCTEWGCIWCGDDSGCHAKFSPHGCIHAESCDSLSHCKRKQPEPLRHNEYAHVNGTATTITILVLVTFLILCYLTMRFVVKYRKRKLKINRHILGDYELQRFLNEPYRMVPNQPAIDPQVLPFQQRVMSDSVINIRSLRRDLVPPFDYRRDKYVRLTGCALSLCSALAISISILVILLFPTIPEYYICDTETDWNEIWSAMEHLTPQSQFDILFSVKNNNYFSTELSDIGVRIYYEKKLIGHYYSDEEGEKGQPTTMYIPHHSMTDIAVPVTINPSIFKAYHLWSLYQANELPLEIEFFADTSTYFLNKDRDWKLLDYHLNLQIRDYVVGANLTTDRTGCNCPANPL